MLISIDVGIKNLALCILDKVHIHEWRVINLTYGNNLCTSIIQALNELQLRYHSAHIVIERQMTKKMLNIQCYLEMYFRLKGHSVIIYSPKHKLAGTGKENSGGGKSFYQARKKAAIILCKEWLDKYPQEGWIHELWRTTKKKDDISDALMMAIAYQSNPVLDTTQPKDIRARKPTALQQARGNYSKCNIKFFLQTMKAPIIEVAIDKKIMKSIYKFWPTLTDCLRELKLEKDILTSS
uniref:Mitochondrial resolvase Ydc2 catalytic domain-containing protein n=1 Tax=viral metagenome TaxID=1070528 RepID=A0A6C0CS87_9ZZZZ